MKADRARYLNSIAGELLAACNRVRDLIGDNHWLSDGYQKEHLLGEVLRRHAPSGIVASRGFVLDPYRPDACSAEQDLLLVDTLQEAPIFSQGGLVIAFASRVVGTVSVKTNLSAQNLTESVGNLASARRVGMSQGSDQRSLWTGAFFFEDREGIGLKPERVQAILQSALSDRSSGSNLPDIIATAHGALYQVDRSDGAGQYSVSGFDCGEGAAAAFIGHALDHLATQRGAPRAEFADVAGSLNALPLTPNSFVLTL